MTAHTDEESRGLRPLVVRLAGRPTDDGRVYVEGGDELPGFHFVLGNGPQEEEALGEALRTFMELWLRARHPEIEPIMLRRADHALEHGPHGPPQSTTGGAERHYHFIVEVVRR